MRYPRSSMNYSLLLLLLQLLPICSGFSSFSSRTIAPQKSFIARSQQSATALFAAEEAGVTIELKNGDTISVGSVVRVAVEKVKAHQVPAKGRGEFNEKKEFVPAPTDGERATKNLLLPAGLRGVVTKVYDVKKISSNFPIQVKFTPGENTDEGYDPPVAFLMHLGTREIESV
jgi:hypothetical protein